MMCIDIATRTNVMSLFKCRHTSKSHSCRKYLPWSLGYHAGEI